VVILFHEEAQVRQPRRVFRKRPRNRISWQAVILGLTAALAATPAAIPQSPPQSKAALQGPPPPQLPLP
jgi:hypothetical protein